MEKIRKRLCSEAQTIMVDAYMDGATKVEAFTKAFPERAAAVKKVSASASVEFARPEVLDEINRRKAAQDAALIEAARGEAERVTAIWSREDSVRRLMEIAEDCRKRRHSTTGEAELMDRDGIAAARLERETVDSLNKMLGYDAPVKVEQDSAITVRFAPVDGTDGDGEDWTA